MLVKCYYLLSLHIGLYYSVSSLLYGIDLVEIYTVTGLPLTTLLHLISRYTHEELIVIMSLKKYKYLISGQFV